MKTLKLLGAVTLCSALFAGAAVAQEGAVYSLNVVGFQKVEVKDVTTPYTLAATPFLADDDNINNVVGYQLTGGYSSGASDNIMKWNKQSQAYDLYWLLGNVGDPNYDYKWMDSVTGEVATNTDITIGEGFWIRSRQSSTQTVVIVGDVVNDDAITNAIINGYNLISYPFSSEIDIQSTTFTNGGTGGFSSGASDNIMVWDVDGQVYKLYWLLGYVGDPAYDHKWIDSVTGEPTTTLKLQPGIGFWYRHRGSGFDWVEPRPYDLD